MQSMGNAMSDFLAEIQRRAQAAKEASQCGNLQPISKTSYQCPKCQDEEIVLVRIDGYDVARDCECKEARKAQRAFKSSKITDEFRNKTFDTFILEDRPSVVQGAYQCALAYSCNFDRIRDTRNNSIALVGRPGSGKTHLLMGVANGLLERGINVLYFPWVEGFNEIKDDLSLTEERINRMQRVDVLYIDDMWKGRKEPTPFQLEQMFAVINYRYMERKPVLISSERNFDQMCQIDEAIGSRIYEMCRDFKVVLDGKNLNYRLRDEAV